MKFLRWPLLAAVLAFSAHAADDIGLIEDQYIVRLAPPAGADVDALAAQLLAPLPGANLLFTYDTVLTGFSVRMGAAEAALLAASPLISMIEQDRVVIASNVQSNATWGLDRVDQADLPLDGLYDYPASAGAGAHVYVIDTGINPDHAEFAGRVGTSRNFVASGLFFAPDPDAWEDCEGHGTHVASTAAGTTWGVAKLATVHAVRVLDCLGSGSGSAIIAGMEWVAENAERPAVVNMSLGTLNGRSQAQEDAAAALYAQDILPVVAAGNDSANACNTSPAAEPTALTVASSDSADRQSSFSNHGPCVDLFAPGTSITAANHSNNSGSKVLSGTSMASPHAAGAAAILLGANSTLSAADLTQALLAATTPNTLTQVSANTPNRLLFVADDGGTPPPVDQPPNAAFVISCTELSCSFDASGSGDDNGIASYAWSFGDGANGSGQSVAHTYAADGSYSVTLTVTDSAGQTDTATQSVDVAAAGTEPPPAGTVYEGSLSGSNDFAIHPPAGFSYAGGTLAGDLSGPAGTDFDLRLQRYSCFFVCSWSNVASATTVSSNESIRYNAAAGTYRWRVESYSGAGAYTLVADPQ